MSTDAKTETGDPTAEAVGFQETPEIDLAAVGRMTKTSLVALAELLRLPTDGNKKDLLQRIRAKKLGGDKKHVHGKTLCPCCGHVVEVTHAEAGQYRRVRCRHCDYRGKVAWE